MKNFLVVCLLAAIGAVFAIESAHAQQRMLDCYLDNGRPCPPPMPIDPRRFDRMDQPQGNSYPDRGYGRRPDAGLMPSPDQRFAGSCGAFGQRLMMQGFARVRPVSCGGRVYVYRAWRDGQRLNIYVSSRSGRIRQITPAY